MSRKTATKKPDAVERARLRLRAAIDKACMARGEAQYTMGYRAGTINLSPKSEDDRLYEKQMAQFRYCDVAEKAAERAMRDYARAVAGAGKPRKRSS